MSMLLRTDEQELNLWCDRYSVTHTYPSLIFSLLYITVHRSNVTCYTTPMTDFYFIGCRRDLANRIKSNALLAYEDSGPDSQYCYWQLAPLHGDMDLYSVEYQWSILGAPDFPEEMKQSMIDDMRVAAQYRYQLHKLLDDLLKLGDTPHFVINDLGSCEGDWQKFTHPEPISLRVLLNLEYYHRDHWFVITESG